MDVIDTWTGRMACQLQAALRMSREAFAEHLGVHPRTVAGWHARPDIVPRAEIQSALDTAYGRAPSPVRLRFAHMSRPPAEPGGAQALRVAIAVVVRHSEVLLVCRRDGGALAWQFPAGIVKPGATAEVVAAQETHAETGVHASVREHLGSRVHPVTGALCEYYLAEHLTGEAANLDPLENAAVQWVPQTDLPRFIPEQSIYPPILEALA